MTSDEAFFSFCELAHGHHAVPEAIRKAFFAAWEVQQQRIDELTAQVKRLRSGVLTPQEVADLPVPITLRNALNKALKGVRE